jgi:oligoendopeptidase F
MNKYKNVISSFLFVLMAITITFSQSPERKEVPEKYKWNLSDIYPSVEAWQSDVKMLNSKVADLSSYQGKLGESADMLDKALNSGSDFSKTLSKA